MTDTRAPAMTLDIQKLAPESLEAAARAIHDRHEALTHWVRSLGNAPRAFEDSGIREVHMLDAQAAITAFLSSQLELGYALMPIAVEQRSEQEQRSTSNGWGFCEFCKTRRHRPCRNNLDAEICPPPLDAGHGDKP